MLTDLACNSNNYYWLNNKGREDMYVEFFLFSKKSGKLEIRYQSPYLNIHPFSPFSNPKTQTICPLSSCTCMHRFLLSIFAIRQWSQPFNICVCKDSKSFLSTKTKIFGDDEKKSDNFGRGHKMCIFFSHSQFSSVKLPTYTESF